MQSVLFKTGILDTNADGFQHLIKLSTTLADLPEEIKGFTVGNAQDELSRFLDETASNVRRKATRYPADYQAFHDEFDAEIGGAPDVCYRQDVIAQIRAFMSNPPAGKHFAVVGGPGTGKTTLAITLLKRLSEERKRPLHFLVAFGRGDRDQPRLILADLAVQLSPSIFDADFIGTPSYEGQAVRLLQSACDGLESSKPMFIVIDAVDETEPQPHGNASLGALLRDVKFPSHVHLILFSRPSATFREFVKDYDIDLEAGDYQNKALARFYQAKLGKAAYSSINAAKLLEYTERSFLYAELTTVEEIIQNFAEGIPADKITAPRGLAERLKKDRERLVNGPVGSDATSQILSTLVAHRGNPTLEEWTRFSNVQWLTLNRFLTVHEGIFKLESRRSSSFEPSLRVHGFKHAEIRRDISDNLIRTEAIRQAHERIVDVYRRNRPNGVWHRHPADDRYFYSHIAWHMLSAERYWDCVDLVTSSPEWMRRQRDVCGSDAQFRDDVTKAMAAIPPEDVPENLIAFTKLWTAQLITAHSEAISDQLLTAMARVGKVDDALSIVRSRPDSLSKLSSFTAIHSVVADHPPSTLLDAVADLEARLNLHAQLHIDIETLVSTAEILGRRGFAERSERLFHKAKQIIDDHSFQMDKVGYLARLAVAYHLLDNPSRSHAALKKAARTFHAATPRKEEAYTSTLLTLLAASLACSDKESSSLLVQAPDEVKSIPKHWGSHCGCFQTIEAICQHNSEEAAELLNTIHVEATTTQTALESGFWAAFLRSYLMLPAPNMLLVERILPKATLEMNLTSVITLSCVSIRLSLAGRKSDAQKYADRAAEAYNTYASTYSDVDVLNSEPWTGLLAAFTYSHEPIYIDGQKIDRGAILQWLAGVSLTMRSSCSYGDKLKQSAALAWLSAAFTHLRKNDVEQRYTQSMVHAIADVSGLPVRGTLLAECANTFAFANLMDKARAILDNRVLLLYETTDNPEYDDYRVETLHLLTRAEFLDEAVTLLKWSRISSARRLCWLIELFAALSRRGDLSVATIVYAEYVRSLVRWLCRNPSINEVVTVVSSLLEAKREEDALDLVGALRFCDKITVAS
jgi:hypothetical protein